MTMFGEDVRTPVLTLATTKIFEVREYEEQLSDKKVDLLY